MTNQRKNFPLPSLAMIMAIAFLAGCAAQPKSTPAATTTVPVAQQKQTMLAAQKSAMDDALVLKRKIAIGRFSNETMHGKSLLRDANNDTLGKQVSDMLTQRLIESGQFLVLERPDIAQLKAESELAGSKIDLTGADTLIMGSLVEFGRSTDGTVGFWSKSKKQSATAKIALRLVDPQTGLAYFSATGAGEASTETGEVAFAGSTAAYDSTLNDKAIANAITDVVNDIITNLNARPWSTRILTVEGQDIFISGGKLQGLSAGLELAIMSEGRKVKSPQTGFMITLPGKKVATVKVVDTFGTDETNEGSIARLVNGSLDNLDLKTLLVTENVK